MSLMLTRSLLAPALLVGLATFGVDRAPGEELDHWLVLGAGIGSTPSPDIHETVDGGGASGKTYHWDGGPSHGTTLDVSARCIHLHDWGGVVYRSSLIGSQTKTTPAAFVDSAGRRLATGGHSLSYRQVGIQLGVGYGWASSTDPEDLAFYGEVMPFVGIGAANANTEGANATGAVITRSGWGYYDEVGLQLGAYLTERHFIVGVTSFYATGTGKVSIDLPGGGKSSLTTDRDGLGFGCAAGWIF